jgi:ribonuclease E
VQRWPETKRLLGLFVNSSGRAHGRNARRIVHAARQHDRRLAIALLAAAVAHTPEAEEVLRGARMRMARKPSAVARELLRNFPKGGKRRRRRTKRPGNGGERDNGQRTAGRERLEPDDERAAAAPGPSKEDAASLAGPSADGDGAKAGEMSAGADAEAGEPGEDADAA